MIAGKECNKQHQMNMESIYIYHVYRNKITARLTFLLLAQLLTIGALLATKGGPVEGLTLSTIFEQPTKLDSYKTLEAIPNALNYRDLKTALDDVEIASEVFSAQGFRQNERVGVLFAVKSEGEVYEHSKYITDRIDGAEINRVFAHSFRNIFPLLVTQFTTPDGNGEFSCNFSAFLGDEGGFKVESHWNKEEYTFGETFYNFQLWAENMSKLEVLVDEVLTRLMTQADIGEVYTTKAPQVYIAKQQKENGMLVLDIVNASGVREILLSGSKESEFLTETIPLEVKMHLSGSARETITIPAQNQLFVGGDLKIRRPASNSVNPNTDGSWGVFYDDLAANIETFATRVSQSPPSEVIVAPLSRDLYLDGTLRDELMITRTVNPVSASKDYSKFNAFTFDVAGTYDLEIILVKSGIKNFEDQPTAFVQRGNESGSMILKQSDFIQLDGTEDWSDVRSIVFKKYGTGFEEPVTIEIKNLQFVKYDQIPECECTILPGPNPGVFAGRNRR